MDGKPLADDSIVFIPENGCPGGARTDKDGNNVLNFTEGRRGAMPGPNVIRITTEREAEQDENGKVVRPAQRETIPAKYNTNSTQTFDVKADEKNVANFDLKAGG